MATWPAFFAPTRLLVCCALLLALAAPPWGPQHAAAQGGQDQPAAISWQVTRPNPAKLKVGDEATIRFTATVPKGYHIFAAQVPPNGMGYRQASLALEPGAQGIELLGPLTDATADRHVEWDDLMGDSLIYYYHTATYVQRVRITAPTVNAELGLSYQYCTNDDGACFFPDSFFTLAFTLPGATTQAEASPQPQDPPKTNDADPAADGDTAGSPAQAQPEEQGPHQDRFGANTGPEACQGGASESFVAETESAETAWWVLLLTGLGGGFIALLTPCVYPMIPMTVTFFTKRSGASRAQGVRNALLYAGFIAGIYTTAGVLLTLFTRDPAAIHELSTNPWVNLVFFAVLVIFGLSFLGMFEITLPSSWTTKLDKKSGQGGVVGIFFMAMVLVLVSFSCTGPIAGTLLVNAAQGSVIGPAVGMLGFGLAFALPFGLFAVFPNWLTGLPQSGGWLNAVKVVLGFLELALAFKFFSNADLVWHTELLTREVYLAGWIAIFGLLALYLFGAYRLPHDTPLQRIGWPRALLGLVVVWFTLYLVPGLWGAPLPILASLLPIPNQERIGAIAIDVAEAAGSTTYWISGALDRENVLGLLVTLCLLVAVGALGKLPLAKLRREVVSVPRTLLALATLWVGALAFAGLWGGALPALEAVLPPLNRDMGVMMRPGYAQDQTRCALPERQHADRLIHDTPPGFCAFYDLEEAAEYALQVNKPLLVDFTGHNCANCRLMEQFVWRDQDVKRTIRDEYVLVSLFADDEHRLPQPKPSRLDPSRKLRTIGHDVKDLQQDWFGTFGQPYYALLDPRYLHNPACRQLAQPVPYTKDIPTYLDFLQQGVAQYHTKGRQR